MLTVALAALALTYLAPALALHRAGRWPWHRSVLWTFGILAATATVTGPLAARSHEDFRAHMAGHLLLGMLAPILLVLAAPVTLALRALPVSTARHVTAVLASPPLRLLTHPAAAALLNMGGLWLLYTTALYTAMMSVPTLHVLIQVHILTAGYLFTNAFIGIDPAPHRPPREVRAVVLVLALAAHAVLAKFLYGHPPPGVDLQQAQAASQLMYYGGDGVDIALIVIFCWQWYRATPPRESKGPMPRQPPLTAQLVTARETLTTHVYKGKH